MAERSVITGRIVDTTSGTGIAGLRVEALDVSGAFPDLLGYTRTDADGRFRMEALAPDVQALVGRRRVIASLRVIHQPIAGQAPYHVLADTRPSGSEWTLDGRTTDVTLWVDTNRILSTLPSLLPFVVSGAVYGNDGPVDNVVVRLNEHDPFTGTAATLGSTTTDARGRYRITYEPPATKDSRDIFVRVDGSPETDTDTRCHAPPSLRTDVTKAGEVWRGHPTYVRATEDLIGAGVPAAEIKSLTADQHERLACSLRRPVEEIRALSTAHAIAAASSLMGEAKDTFTEVAFAALGRGLGTDRDSLFQHPRSAVKAALRGAIASNQVSQAYANEGTFNTAIQRWVEAAGEWSLEARSNPCGLGELLTVAGVSGSSDRTSFAEQLCANDVAMPAFWDGLAGTFDKPRLQLTFQWWSLTRGHLPLIQELEVRRAAQTEPTLLDLAKFSELEWRENILDAISPSTPPDVPGANETERKENYARILYTTMAAAFPTATFRHRALANTNELPGIKTFLDVAHPEFEFGKKRLAHSTHSAAMQNLGEEEERPRLKAMERLLRFVPTYESVDALITKGYGSAHAVHSAGKLKFLADMQGDLGEGLALDLFKKACWQVRAATSVFAQFGRVTNKLPMKVLANIGQVSSALGIDIPDWQTLFGNAGGCSCKHCAGVLGPAAYLADSLLWLDSFPSQVPKGDGNQWSALDILVGSDQSGTNQPLGRRPDLRLLELTCKSAHTPQPYIDLTNELLEIAVAGNAGPSVSLGDSIKTSHEPAELAAGPEILYEVPHIRSWRSLMQRRHPFTLPVCMFDREAEAYLRYLGVSRADIVETLGGTAQQIAKARLGVREDSFVPPNEPALLSGWGMLIGADPGTAQDHWAGQDASTLDSVPLFLRYSGLDFTELEELLATRYVNGPDGAGAMGLSPLALVENGECNVATMTLSGLTDPHLLRIHRFLRLRLHTGLSSTDLDILLSAFPSPWSPGEIDEPVLRNITGAQALARELKLTVREVAGLFADLDTHERWEKKSPYRQYFLNRLVDSPEPAELGAVLTALPGSPAPTADLSLHRTALQQGLGISERDLLLLVDMMALQTELLLPANERVLQTFGTVTGILESVSHLWRHVRLARALRLKIADYLVLRAYSGQVAIGAGATPVDAMAFVDLVRTFQAQKLSVADIQWILRAFPTPAAAAPDAADVEALGAEITSAVDVIVSETESSEDLADSGGPPADSRTRTFALLDELLDESQRNAVIEVLRGSDNPPSNGSWRDPISYIEAYLPAGAKDLLAGPYLGGVQQPPLLDSAAERFAHVARWLDRHVRASRAVIEKVAAATKLPGATVSHLMTVLIDGQGPAAPALALHLLDDFLPLSRSQSTAEDQARGLALLLRHARLITGLRVGDPIPPAPESEAPSDNLGELSWIYEPSSGELHDLPAQQPGSGEFGPADRARFARIVQVSRRVALRDRMKGGVHALRELLQSSPPDFEQARPLLAEKSGWERDSVDALCPQLGIWSTAQLLEDDNLLKLEKAVSLVRRLGISAERVLAFLDLESLPPPAELGALQPTTTGPKNARDLVIFARHAAKAKVSAEEWAAIAKRVRDPFRELLRDRLVDALVPEPYASRDELYGVHLIDVDTSPCLMTSRVVQATNALQVFVQRSFLGLDAEVKLPPAATKQWEWRKAYRVWEANRKVFLWPENWLEPDLRDDMTPLFKQFLTHLASGEITDSSAERALEKYLSGLHEIARLEPMGHWFDHDSGTDHVIARTRSQPRKWFYRRREDEVWTPWEKMDVDIDAESVLLAGASGRLYLFWPQLTVKNDRPAPKPVVVDSSTTLQPPGPMPIYELGETIDEYLDRFKDWHADVQEWNDKVGQTPAEAEQSEDQEPAQHYQVRVAWSSYLDGAWTQKRMSDCEPVKITDARGERQTGYEPRHVVFVLEPQLLEPAAGIVRLLCVATPWFEGLSNAKAGRFYFDACDGGRWTSKQLNGNAYTPTSPDDSRLSALGFEQFGGDGAIVVRHAPPGQYTPVPVKLLKTHEGRFFIVSPSSSMAGRSHPFDRFLFADHKAVFHGRALRLGDKWTNAMAIKPGQPVEAQLPAGAPGMMDAALQWSMQKAFQAPQESADRYALEIFEHPYVCEFADRLATGGISGLLGWKDDPEGSAQYLSREIKATYDPTARIAEPFPKHDVSFELGTAYGQYNWELFFHVPFTIAQRLSQEGRYAEAQKWFHYIFNPTTGLAASGPKRFWCVKPFYEVEDLSTIGESLSSLAAASSFAASLQALVAADDATEKAAEDLEKQIAAMSKDPFSPHVVARLRPLAYMKNVFMRYVQNLLDWGDSLFRRDTMESTHEALTLYLLAADLLGPRPEIIEHKADPVGKTFKQLLEDGLDAFGNAAVEVETIVPKIPPRGFECTDDGPPVPDFRLYFCVPPNEQLYGLWDTVADRLFKIRNCMNIEGVARSLPLFAPPIDPAILVRASAAGVRLDQVLDALAAPAPLYRFVRLHAKAAEFAGAVQALGQGLLSALEKKDGEELTLLRQRHETAVLDAERDVRRQAIEEAKETLSGLNRSLRTAETRFQHYDRLMEKGLLQQEKDAEQNTRVAKLYRQGAADLDSASAVIGTIPDIIAGTLSGAQIGGRAAQLAMSAAARRLSFESDSLTTDASLAQTAAGYARRAEDWKLQRSLADKEIAQLHKQIAAQEIRVAIAERELDNLDLRREHSREVDSYFRSKFTSQDLYTWMSAQLASEHYRAYQTAYDMAKRAERAYQLERGDETSFIRFGAWDSLKKGLLAGERLLQDLRALDAAYLSRSDREREITKHISLAEVDGEQLTRLRDIGAPEAERGKAEIELHPHHFDADYPGQYFRRIKNVAITVATVKSAADGVQCELTLLKSSYRKTSQISDSMPYPGDPYVDPAYRFSMAPVKVLATSTAENDPGLFEVSLKDEMLLPVEGSGAVSQWRIEIDHRTNRFPMHRISDVVLHLRYTAKDGGSNLREQALTHAGESPDGLTRRTRVFSARRDFDEAWRVFTAGQLTAPNTWANKLELRFVQSQFRSFFGDPKVKIVRVQVSATFNDKYTSPPPPETPPPPLPGLAYTLTIPTGTPATTDSGTLEFRTGEPSDLHLSFSAVPVPRDDEDSVAPWFFDVAPASTPSGLWDTGNHGLLKPDVFEDIWFIVTYERQS